MRSDGGSEGTVTRLLVAWSRGEVAAVDRLVPLVLEELRRRARWLMLREAPGHTLDPTALVNELYLRLAARDTVSWRNSAQFFGVAVDVMRRILVDHARTRDRLKRRPEGGRAPLEEAEREAGLAVAPDVDVLALEAALEGLRSLAPRACRTVELRFYVGLSMDQIAEVLEVSLATVHRDWTMAKAWLYRELHGRGDGPEGKTARGARSLDRQPPRT